MQIKYFILYVIIMGILGILRYSYIQTATSDKMVKKRDVIHKEQEELISLLYVEYGYDKESARQYLNGVTPYLVFALSWLIPVYVLYKFLKGFIRGLFGESNEQR